MRLKVMAAEHSQGEVREVVGGSGEPLGGGEVQPLGHAPVHADYAESGNLGRGEGGGDGVASRSCGA